MSIKDDIKKMQGDLNEMKPKDKKKERKFKLPSKAKVSFMKAKKNYITVMKVLENNNVDFKRVLIDEQTFMEEGIPRLIKAEHVVYYKKNPMIILQNTSVMPVNFHKLYDINSEEGSNVAGYKLLMNKMKQETAGIKKKVAGGMIKWIVGFILLAIVGYALLSGGGA
jgi:hypothetical protein